MPSSSITSSVAPSPPPSRPSLACASTASTSTPSATTSSSTPPSSTVALTLPTRSFARSPTAASPPPSHPSSPSRAFVSRAALTTPASPSPLPHCHRSLSHSVTRLSVDDLLSAIEHVLELQNLSFLPASYHGERRVNLVWVSKSYGQKFPREFALLMKQTLYFDQYTRLLAPNLNMLHNQRISLTSEQRMGEMFSKACTI